MDYFVLAVTSLILFAATFFSTVTGFGFALIAAPLLTFFMEPKETVVFVIVAGFVGRFIMMWRTWGEFEWKTILITLCGTLIGVIPGAYFLKIVDANHLKILLGIGLLLATVLMEFNFVPEVNNKKLGRLCAGFLSGFFSATTSISGPPIVLYFLSEKTEKNLLRANMVWIFAIGSFFTLASFFVAGTFQSGNLLLMSVYVIPAVLLGWWIGEKMFFRINQHLFKRLALLVVLIGGLMTLGSGIKAVLQ